jgi:hypothetical protein
VYNIFRWYRAGWGRYTQADPIGVGGGMNLFSYGSENPLNNNDPRGLKCCAKSMTAKLQPVIKNSKIAIKSVVCADVCGNSADCSFEQLVDHKKYLAHGEWGSVTLFESDVTTPGAFDTVRPSKNKVCLVDTGVGLGNLDPSAFPIVDVVKVKVTIKDNTGVCGSISGEWSGTIVCSDPNKCDINGQTK